MPPSISTVHRGSVLDEIIRVRGRTYLQPTGISTAVAGVEDPKSRVIPDEFHAVASPKISRRRS